MIAKEIMDYLEQYFPLSYQLSFDKCGLQIGDSSKEVKKVMVSLNCDQATIDKAITNNCDMLISHHPLLLEKHDAIDTSVPFGKFVQKAIQHDLVVYSLHTCLDKGKNGISMNDWLISLFDVSNIECYDEVGIGKKAILNQPVSLEQFLHQVKEVFSLESLKYVGNKEMLINTLALCGGSGSDDIAVVADQVDVYITGDTKYHHGQFALERNIALVDVGHHIEVIVENKLASILKELPIDVLEAQSKDYFNFL